MDKPTIHPISSGNMHTVNLYFVASPLQYLAARAIAEHSTLEERQILVWYKPGVGSVIAKQDWDTVFYMPWPRFYPLPGRFGRLRRLIENIEMVSGLIGKCDTLNIHSAVFDTEAINYFLRALPQSSGAKHTRARILPDGIISIRRYPLNCIKRVLQYLKKLRYLVDRRLNYWCFSGDRIGSDAPFCDRIYVIAGLPHEYPPDKTVALPPLVKQCDDQSKADDKRALVIGQPLVGSGLLSQDDLKVVTQDIWLWLQNAGFKHVDYKQHPKDPNLELCCEDYSLLDLAEPLETWMAKKHYGAVLGVRSSALLFARQVYATDVPVLAFGWNKIRFKSESEALDMKKAFISCNVYIYN